MPCAMSRFYGLDFIRCLAIVLVLSSHLFYVFPKAYHNHRLLSDLLGRVGVEIFFGLSGFLIGLNLLRLPSGLIPLIQFMYRRSSRILPNYFLFLVVYLVYYDVSVLHTQRYWVLLQNFSEIHPRFFPQAWSLGVEFWSYLYIPLFIIFCLRLKSLKYRFLGVCFLLSFAGFFSRIYCLDNLSTWWSHDFMAISAVIVYRLDALVFGLVTAWVYIHSKTPRAFQRLDLWLVLLWLAQTLILPLMFWIVSKDISLMLFSTLNLLQFFTACAIFTLASTNPAQFNFKPIRWLADCSYTVYLAHFLFQNLIFHQLPMSLPIFVSAGVYLLVLTLCSFFWFSAIERPVTKWLYQLTLSKEKAGL